MNHDPTAIMGAGFDDHRAGFNDIPNQGSPPYCMLLLCSMNVGQKTR